MIEDKREIYRLNLQIINYRFGLTLGALIVGLLIGTVIHLYNRPCITDAQIQQYFLREMQ